MPVRIGKANDDKNIWGVTHNDYHRVLQGNGEYIEVIANGNNPPSVARYSNFLFYNNDTSYTIPSSVATGNAVYSTGDQPDYYLGEAIFENNSTREFAWDAGGFSTQKDATWYLYCSGANDTSSTSIGLGNYGASTEVPTYSYDKGGWYNASTYRVLAEFDSTGGTVTLTRTFVNPANIDSSGAVNIVNNTLNKDINFSVNIAGTQGFPLIIDASEFITRAPDAAKLAVGNDNDGQLYASSDDFIIANATTDKDIIFQVQNGVEQFRLDADTSQILVSDGTRLTFSTNANNHIYGSSNNLVIESTEANADIEFGISDGGSTKILFKMDASESYVQVSTGRLTLGTSNKSQLYESSSDMYMENTSTSGDLIFRTLGGLTNLRIDALASLVRIVDNNKLSLGTGDDGLIYSNSDDLYLEVATTDKDMIFRTQNGVEQFRLDADSSLIRILDNSKLTIGTGDDLQISVSSDDAIINQATTDKDIIFQVQDGIEHFRLDASASYVSINSSIKLAFGTSTGVSNIYASSSSALVIENTFQDGDILFGTNDGTTKVLLTIDGSNNVLNLSEGKLTFGTSSNCEIYESSSDFFIENDSSYGDIVFRTLGGFENLRLTGAGALARVKDGGKLSLGNGDDGLIYASGDDLYIENATTNKDIIFRTQNGVEQLRIDADSSAISLLDSAILTIGTGNDLQLSVVSDDAIINQATTDKDIIFQTQDGVEVLRLDADTSQVKIPDSAKIAIGTGADGLIHSVSDDLIIENATTDKDVILRTQGSIELLRLDADSSVVRIPDDKKLSIGTGNDLQIYSTGVNAIVDMATTDSDLIFQIQNGVESMRLDAGTSSLRLLDNTKLSIGTGNDLQMSVSSDDAIINQATTDKDIIFQTQNGVEVMRLDADSSIVKLPDSAKLVVGTGNDLNISVSSDDGVINQATTAKDIIIQVNDGVEVGRFNGTNNSFVASDHSTTYTNHEVVNVTASTSATPPNSTNTTLGTLFIQYST